MKKSAFKKEREVNKQIRKDHNEQVNKIIDDTYNQNEAYFRVRKYNNIKKMKWFDYLISLTIAIFFTGLSFLVGYLAINSSKAPDYQASGWTSLIAIVFLVVVFIILNWIKNRNSAKFFNDKRRRYQRTLEPVEAKILLSLKILFLGIILLAPTVIATNIVFN